MRGRLFGILAIGVMLMGLSARPGAAADDKERALHFWGKIIDIDKSGHHFTVEGRWALIVHKDGKDEGKDGKLGPKDTDDRQQAHNIEIVEEGPAIHPKTLKFCCDKEKTSVLKINGDRGECKDLTKKDTYVCVRAKGKCKE
jgi:hypothetical protein